MTADEPSQFLSKCSCVSIICRIEHNLFLSFNTMPIGKASGYDLISNEHLKYMQIKNSMFLCHCYAIYTSTW